MANPSVAVVNVVHALRHDRNQFVVLDGRLFNRDQIVAVTNSKTTGQAIVTTRGRDFDVEVPFTEVVQLLTQTDAEQD